MINTTAYVRVYGGAPKPHQGGNWTVRFAHMGDTLTYRCRYGNLEKLILTDHPHLKEGDIALFDLLP